GIGGWLAVVVVVMMDGVIVDLGEGIGVTVDEPVVKMDSIPGSIIGFNSCLASVRSTSEGSVGLVALAATIVVVGVRVAIGVEGVVDEAEPPFFFLALAFGFGAASP
nr:hypothetical protein [Tanacetum cinerariifolium]